MNLADKEINLFLLSIILFKNELTCHDYQQKKKQQECNQESSKGQFTSRYEIDGPCFFHCFSFLSRFFFSFYLIMFNYCQSLTCLIVLGNKNYFVYCYWGTTI